MSKPWFSGRLCECCEYTCDSTKTRLLGEEELELCDDCYAAELEKEQYEEPKTTEAL
jgi:ribosome-binding protein aMBF1 (putative translation factor)